MNKPNYTQTPNVFFDEIMADLGYAETKCLLYIFRRTFGFHKQSDRISLTQFEKGIKNLDKGTGLKRPNIVKALKKLTEKGIIKVNKGYTNSYSLLLVDYEVVTEDNQTSNAELPKIVTQDNTQKKEKESKQKKDSEASSQEVDSLAGVSTVNEVIAVMKPLNALGYSMWFKNKTQRKAVEQIMKNYSIEDIRDMVSYIIKNRGESEPYTFPSVTTPLQFIQKHPNISMWREAKSKL